jgi:hypothetical protein
MINFKIIKNTIFTFCLLLFVLISSAQVCPPIKGTIKIIPTPVSIPCTANVVASPTAQTIFSGESTNIALTSSIPGTTFKWSVSQTGVTGATDGNGNTIVQVLTNVGTAIFTITPMLSNCSGTPINVTVNVNAAQPTSYAFRFSSPGRTSSSLACSQTTFPLALYASDKFLNVGTKMYTSPSLSSPVGSGNLWYQNGIDAISYLIDNVGVIAEIKNCETEGDLPTYSFMYRAIHPDQHPGTDFVVYIDEIGNEQTYILHRGDGSNPNPCEAIEANRIVRTIGAVSCDCQEYEIVGGENGRTVTYKDCSGNSQTVVVPQGDSIPVCSSSIIGGATLNGDCTN